MFEKHLCVSVTQSRKFPGPHFILTASRKKKHCHPFLRCGSGRGSHLRAATGFHLRGQPTVSFVSCASVCKHFSGLAKISGMRLGVVKAKDEVGQPSRVCPDHGNPQCREDLALGPGAPGLALLSALLISWNLC